MTANQTAPLLRPADLVQNGVDSTANVVDPRQDTSSTQSGSDSGLGYSNSSDSSTILATKAPSSCSSSSHDQHQQAYKETGCASLLPELNNNNNNDSSAKYQQNLQPSASNAAIKGILSSKSESGSGDETTSTGASVRFIDTPTTISKQVSQAKLPSTTATVDSSSLSTPSLKTNTSNTKASDGLSQLSNQSLSVAFVLERPSSLAVDKNSDLGHTKNSAPAIKSLLKKPSNLAGSLKDVPKSCKHNRSVSFNQTVIVFCEELDPPSPSDLFQPHISNSSDDSSLNPPVDYCDSNQGVHHDNNNPDLAKQRRNLELLSSSISTSCNTVVAGLDTTLTSAEETRSGDHVHSRRDECDDDIDDDDYDDKDDEDLNHNHNHDRDRSRDSNFLEDYAHTKPSDDSQRAKSSTTNGCIDQLISRKGATLTNDQILGLLEKENLLDAFKLNLDDFSEEDFPINHIGLDHGYLCGAAISDYDSDSESSYYAEEKNSRDKPSLTQTKCHKTGKAAVNVIDHSSSLVPNKLNSSAPDLEITPLTEPEKDLKAAKPQKCFNNNETPLPSTQNQTPKTLPARMKVSPVDTTQTRKNTISKDDIESKLNVESRTAGMVSNAHKTSHSTSCWTHDSMPNIVPSKAGINVPTPVSRPTTINERPIPKGSTNVPVNVAHNFTNSSNAPSLPSARRSQAEDSVDLDLSHGFMSFKQQPIRPVTTLTRDYPACHMCRAIETNRSQPNMDVRSLTAERALSSANLTNFSQHNYFMTLANQVQPVGLQTQTPIFDQSCLSCGDESSKQKSPQEILQGCVNEQPNGVPMAYQIVHLVDQKGNRIRALSLVRPGQQGASQQLVAGRRYVLAPQLLRIANPPTPQSSKQETSSNTINQVATPQSNTQGKIPQYRVLASVPVQQLGPSSKKSVHQQSMDEHYVQDVPRKVSTENVGPRQHTVYYVQQPLNSHNIRQAFDSSGTSLKSFPDPHEIRRLDGVKPPPANPLKCMEQSINSSRDENEDPTFGFSKRPAVKVVAPHNQCNDSNHPEFRKRMNESEFNSLLLRNNSPVANQAQLDPRLGSIIYGSHTLDRRQTSQQQFTLRETLVATNSMSNIQTVLTRGSESNEKSSTYSQGADKARTNSMVMQSQNSNIRRGPGDGTNELLDESSKKLEVVYSMNI